MFSRRVVSRALRPCASRRASSTKAPSTVASSLPPAPAEDTPRSGIAPQAPNYPTPWSTNQRPRPAARSGPRFEQTAMELQPNPLSALELIANEPVRIVQGRRAVCDGGGGPLGHPKIFINLDKPGPHACGYCCSGLRFEQTIHHGYGH
ncbi:ubiquinone oxidoreductase 20 kd subunit [Pisolithus croceorrhizus]|nr:ubiquinone oxidoreductase 20 kd subunit [Pisolithus croceorrhizus]